MTIIAEKDRQTVRDLLARELVDDVELLFFTRSRPGVPGEQDCLTCDETGELLEQLADLSEHLHLTMHDLAADPDASTKYNVTAVPAVLLRRADAADPPNVRFIGQPAGYEFSTLVADIVDISKGKTDLTAATLETVRAVDRPVHIQVFVTPGCPYCPPVARLAHQMAMENALIVSDVIEANEFEDLSLRYRIKTVPKTVIDDRIEFVGALTEAKLVEALTEVVARA